MTWRELIKNGCSTGDELKEVLKLTEEEAGKINEIAEQYPMFVNSYYLSLIDRDNPDDPIRKLSIPDGVEASDEGEEDTSGESENTKLAGMQHKYGQTALVLSTHKCAMYCRHCFRKRMVGITEGETAENISDIRKYIEEHPEINNVLISGGDAFMNSTSVIKEYLKQLCSLKQLELIRFGTRIPVVLPQRITGDNELLAVLGEYAGKKQIFIITQFNHPNEITKEASEAVKALLKLGIVVRNQTVLLRGINDNPEILGTLLSRLCSIGVLPYYVFQCRPVKGVHNQFQVPFKEGYEIVEQAKHMQNGQGKSFRFAMSHVTGKIEILGPGENGDMLFKYHQAKYEKDRGRIFSVNLKDGQCWLD